MLILFVIVLSKRVSDNFMCIGRWFRFVSVKIEKIDKEIMEQFISYDLH